MVEKKHQLGLTDPLIQVPGHKIHFTATGSGANVSFEALGRDFGQETPNPKIQIYVLRKGFPHTLVCYGGWD